MPENDPRHPMRIACIFAFLAAMWFLDFQSTEHVIHADSGTTILFALALSVPVWIFFASFKRN